MSLPVSSPPVSGGQEGALVGQRGGAQNALRLLSYPPYGESGGGGGIPVPWNTQTANTGVNCYDCVTTLATTGRGGVQGLASCSWPDNRHRIRPPHGSLGARAVTGTIRPPTGNPVITGQVASKSTPGTTVVALISPPQTESARSDAQGHSRHGKGETVGGNSDNASQWPPSPLPSTPASRQGQGGRAKARRVHHR